MVSFSMAFPSEMYQLANPIALSSKRTFTLGRSSLACNCVTNICWRTILHAEMRTNFIMWNRLFGPPNKQWLPFGASINSNMFRVG